MEYFDRTQAFDLQMLIEHCTARTLDVSRAFCDVLAENKTMEDLNKRVAISGALSLICEGRGEGLWQVMSCDMIPLKLRSLNLIIPGALSAVTSAASEEVFVSRLSPSRKTQISVPFFFVVLWERL